VAGDKGGPSRAKIEPEPGLNLNALRKETRNHHSQRGERKRALERGRLALTCLCGRGGILMKTRNASGSHRTTGVTDSG